MCKMFVQVGSLFKCKEDNISDMSLPFTENPSRSNFSLQLSLHSPFSKKTENIYVIVKSYQNLESGGFYDK